MIYYLFVTFFVAFEVQKLLQLNFFFRLRSISARYSKNILKRTKSIAYKEITRIALLDMTYMIVLLIGCFTINRYFFLGVLLLSAIQTFVFKLKNKTFKKIFFIMEIVISILLLTLAIINYSYYQLDSVQFLKHIYSLWQ